MRIRRRTVNLDLLGRLLSEHVEQLAEDDQGNVEEIHATAVWACPACGRPIGNADSIREACAQCGRQCCETCLGSCSICRQPLCGHCRVGFAEKGLSVCANCLRDLLERLARQDRLMEDKIAFERLMTLYSGLMKLIQPGTHERRGSISEIVGQIVHFRLARRLWHTAEQLAKERERDQRLLP